MRSKFCQLNIGLVAFLVLLTELVKQILLDYAPPTFSSDEQMFYLVQFLINELGCVKRFNVFVRSWAADAEGARPLASVVDCFY